jgi:hypothetical protein
MVPDTGIAGLLQRSIGVGPPQNWRVAPVPSTCRVGLLPAPEAVNSHYPCQNLYRGPRLHTVQPPPASRGQAALAWRWPAGPTLQ